MTLSNPARAKELRDVLDISEYPTVYSPPSKGTRGLSHYIWIYRPDHEKFLVMVETERYAVFDLDEDEKHFTGPNALVEAMERIREIYRS